MIRLAKYTQPYLWWLLLAIALLFAQANFDLALPDYTSQIVNIGIQGGAGNAYILRTGGSMLLLTLLSGVCTVLVVIISSRVAAGMARDIRKDVFKKVSSFSNIEFDKFSTASLITRSTNDITQIQMVVAVMVRIVFYAPIIAVGGIIRMMGNGSSMWWLIGVAVMVSLSIIVVIISISLPRYRRIQTLIDRLNLVAREVLSGTMVIRAFNMQSFEEKRFDQTNQELTAVSLFVNRVMVVMMPLMMLIMNSLGVAIVWVGARQVAQANMQVGDMMAIMQYAMQIVMAFLMLSTLIIVLPRAQVSSGRIADVLETKPVIQDPQTPECFAQPFNGTIEFCNVSFRYPGAEECALQNISFTALPGQTTAFIGTTGAGKSTVVNLVPRFYDVTDGVILVNGTDIRRVTQHDLRDKIGYVPQKSILFSGTIETNLRYADQNASEEGIQSAINIAQAAGFVSASPEGTALVIAQGGANVSGGQKQRMSIARALVKKPPIYIFDDSFSALDFKTDAALRLALKQETGASTLLIVTQRVSTIKNAEQIIVLDEGRIVSKGTHTELMKTSAIYKEFATSQLSMEELA
jgi:ATP-binding cassette subfamily B multidrug efflux pump